MSSLFVAVDVLCEVSSRLATDLKAFGVAGAPSERNQKHQFMQTNPDTHKHKHDKITTPGMDDKAKALKRKRAPKGH
jgi:hypothetical protein